MKAIYTIEKIQPLPFGSCGKKSFTSKEEAKKYIIEKIDWFLALDYADGWGKSNGCFIVEKIQLVGDTNVKD